jgi:beta-lactamase class A
MKMVIMAAVYRAYDRGEAHPKKLIALRRSDLIEYSPVLGKARPGDRYALQTLTEAMIRWSDNTAADSLITVFGIEAINATARACGMTGTTLVRRFVVGGPPNLPNLNVTTPNDVGELLYQIERGAHEGINTVAHANSCRAMVNLLLGQRFREMIPSGITRRVPIANKTGNVDHVRNDAAIIDPFGGFPYVLVVLSRDLPDEKAAEASIAAIARRVDSVLGRA